jgi:uncharacterized SAM-binding protein YcdF (DUF218 family)
MYFSLSKLLWLGLAPSNALLGLIALGALLILFRRRIAGLLLIFPALLLLASIGLFRLDESLAQTLETRFPLWQDDGRPVDGIVVLGGSIRLGPSAVWNLLAMNGAADRLVAMADLGRRYPDAKLVFTGGYGSMFGHAVSEADIVARHSASLGLDPARVIFEALSRNTRENAVFTYDLVKPKPGERWLLVTSAWHMPRSMGLFRKAGWQVEAYPVGFTSAPGQEDVAILPELSEHLARFDMMAREWTGLLAAFIAGYSEALFPAP